MRIYITGSQSSGKTTIGRYISQKYNLHFINEVARTVLAEKELNIDSLRVNLDVVDDFQSTIFYRQLDEEKKYEDFVSDRSFDNLAYAAQHSRILSKLFFSQQLNDYVKTLKNNDVTIFFVRPHPSTLQDDGIRERINWDGAVAIDAMIKFMFEVFELPYINVNTSSIQERIRLVDSVICGKYYRN
jgi:predicted ATPase